MNPTDERAAQKYRTLVSAMEDPSVGQTLGPAVQRAMVDHPFGLATFGPDEPMEIGRFVRLADAVFRGQMVQADMMATQRDMFLTQMGLMKAQALTTHQHIERFKKGLTTALEEAESGYRITKMMYITLFVLGVTVFVVGVVAGLLGLGTTLSTTIGVLGGAATLATLLFKQQKALESSRADLMQLEIAVFSWLDNCVRLSTSLQMLSQNGTKMTAELLENMWQQSHRATADVLDLIQTYCEDRPAAVTPSRGAKKSDVEEKA